MSPTGDRPSSEPSRLQTTSASEGGPSGRASGPSVPLQGQENGEAETQSRASSRRNLISPATIVNIKQAFGKNALKSDKDAKHTALDESWDCVRPATTGTGSNIHSEGQNRYSAAFANAPSKLDNPRNSVTSAFLSPNNVTQEPASYLNSPNLETQEVEDAEYDSNDSHSGDEYTHLKRKRKSTPRPASQGYFGEQDVDADQASRLQRILDFFRLPDLTAAQRGILKCSIAYFIATLFTFVPALSKLIASPFDLDHPIRGSHSIATVATYYNPAKSLGEMMEADIFMIWAASFALLACLGSMSTAVWLNEIGLHTTSHVVIVVIWLAGSMGLVAWMKVKVGKAQFGSACSMIALIIAAVICQEGSVHIGIFRFAAISQTFFIVILGTVISNLVCFFVWRGSATSKLQGDINKVLESYATLLDLLCSSFLSEGTTSPISDEALKKAIDAHRSSFTSLKGSLEAAKLELWDYRIQRTQKAYDQVLASMNRLGQHLTGLRNAVSLERELDVLREKQARAQAHQKTSTDGQYRSDHEAGIMERFVQHVGPSLKSLSATSRQALKDVRASFIQSRAGEKSLAAIRASDAESGSRLGVAGLKSMKEELEEALSTYRTAHTKAIKRLYRHFPSNAGDQADFVADAGDPALDSAPSEEIFMIYFFCFNLEEFAKEQAHLIDAFRGIRDEEEQLEREKQVYVRKFGTWVDIAQTVDVFSVFAEKGHHHGKTHRWATLKKKLIQLMPLSSTKAPSPFPRTDDTARTSHSAAQERRSGLVGRFRRQLWEFGIKLRHPDIVFSIKTGIGCAMLGAFAFNHSTRPIFVRWSGNWAMLTYMVVVSTTVGATNFNAFFRIGGTILGATIAVGLWYLFHGHPVLLCIASFFFSIPCFWLIVTMPKFATTGRFILLSYNLTALYAYKIRASTDIEVEDVAIRRTVAVTVGTLWGWVVTQYVFPFEARKEMRKGLTEFLFQSAYFYERLVAYVSNGGLPSQDLRQYHDGERTPLLPGHGHNVDKIFVEMELHLQVSLVKLGALLDHSKHEPRLKGPFPTGPYANVLQLCQRMLDTLHSMRTVATRKDFLTTIRREFIIPSNVERREVAGNIILFMSLLATDLALKAPLPPFFPPVEASRKRLVAKIGTLPVVQQRAVRGTTAFLLYYSYALMEKELVVQLEKIGSIFQYLFGVLGDSEGAGTGVETFESFFTDLASVGGSRRDSFSSDSSEDASIALSRV